MHDIKTRFLIISETHAKPFTLPNVPVDVAIHCGDLTDESKLGEFRTTLALLKSINAPLKLVIAGNHDFTLDLPTFQKKTAEAQRLYSIEPQQMEREFGKFGEARRLFEDAKGDGIVFLDEGIHRFELENGAGLTVYASPYTSSREADWGFQYKQGDRHDFDLNGADVVITHGPPNGVLDRTGSRKRGGCEQLFADVARARPRMHCFGHIHEGWGAKVVAWRDVVSDVPSHMVDIDNEKSTTVDTLAALRPEKWDSEGEILEKERRLGELRRIGYRETDHCSGSEHPVMPGRTTLFVNAAIESMEEEHPQLPWVVDIELPAAASK
ncbi:Metallo-dependent phosphatase-like protein [Podospora aff. communis PSN243]|uniref:Metallo-dependent phosphatase-like protein n=1 Tax=Podospora aff. communis PSN243 TaxID=3040156 RepID=A0AAV9H706_9PEZI|nr:Metallo-dependent phosphatase-like protein [Podospora aff. communis PSN243]